MILEDSVICSGGLVVAQRGAEIPEDSGPVLRITPAGSIRPPATGVALEARMADGTLWRRHWVEQQRLVIDFVGLAVAEVDDVRRTITFNRVLSADMEQHLVFDHVLPLVLATRGELVLHAAVISLEGRGVVLVGSSGAGKSTLTAFAWQRGWTVGNDDGAVLFTGRPPAVQPTYATLRLTPASLEMLDMTQEFVETVVGKVRLAGQGPMAFRMEPVELSLIAVIEPVDSVEKARFDRLDGISAHAALFGSTFHAEFSRGRHLPRVVEELASIVEASTVGRLAVPRGIEGLAGAESVLRRLITGTEVPLRGSVSAG